MPLPKRRILLVEDDADVRVGMRMVLELDGHEVDEAAGGLEGLRKTLNANYDIAFVDLHLSGGMDGHQFIQQLRDSPAKHMSVVALTGGSVGHSRQEALDAGFDAFLLKPASSQVVNALLENLPRKPN